MALITQAVDRTVIESKQAADHDEISKVLQLCIDGAAKADVAKLTEAFHEVGYWGTVSFVDYFALARINGTWKIVNKVFAHTGG